MWHRHYITRGTSPAPDHQFLRPSELGSNHRFPALQASALPLYYVIGYVENHIGLTATEPPQHIAQRDMPHKAEGSQAWRPGRHYRVGTPFRPWVGGARVAVAIAAPRRAVATAKVQAFRVLAALPWATHSTNCATVSTPGRSWPRRKFATEVCHHCLGYSLFPRPHARDCRLCSTSVCCIA